MTTPTHIISTSDAQGTLADEATNHATTAGTTGTTANGTSVGQDDGGDVVTIEATMDDTDNTVHTSPNIRKRMRFSSTMDILLLQAVTLHDAHIAPHGMMQKRFEDVFDVFLKTLPSSAVKNCINVSWKTLSDRFRKLVVDRRFTNRKTVGMSGISECFGEREQLLDDVIHTMYESTETVRDERGEKT